jgi:hypothetical protein
VVATVVASYSASYGTSWLLFDRVFEFRDSKVLRPDEVPGGSKASTPNSTDGDG